MAKEFEPHMMYGDGQEEMANTKEQHLGLKEEGWGHDSPAPFKLREVNSPMKCWDSHKKVGMKDSPTYGASKQVNDCVKK